MLATQLHGKGNVAVFTIPAQANLEERLRGYKDALAGYPDIKIVQTARCRGNPSVAFDQAIQMMEAGKTPINAFVCLEALAGKEVAEVLSRKKIQDRVVIAMDTQDDTLEWIDKGVITATIAQRPYTMAYYGLKVLDDLHHHPPKPLNARWEEILSSPVPAVDRYRRHAGGPEQYRADSAADQRACTRRRALACGSQSAICPPCPRDPWRLPWPSASPAPPRVWSRL